MRQTFKIGTTAAELDQFTADLRKRRRKYHVTPWASTDGTKPALWAGTSPADRENIRRAAEDASPYASATGRNSVGPGDLTPPPTPTKT